LHVIETRHIQIWAIWPTDWCHMTPLNRCENGAITLSFADAVGKILSDLPKEKFVQVHYQFFM